jgi:hypothetical protein
MTDGLRAVLFFERKPISISQLHCLGWERASPTITENRLTVASDWAT